jgi:hypothetical protein
MPSYIVISTPNFGIASDPISMIGSWACASAGGAIGWAAGASTTSVLVVVGAVVVLVVLVVVGAVVVGAGAVVGGTVVLVVVVGSTVVVAAKVGAGSVVAAAAPGSFVAPHAVRLSNAATVSAAVEARRVRRTAGAAGLVDIGSIMPGTHRCYRSIP